MNIFLRTLLFLLFIGFHNSTSAMFSSKFKSLALKQAAIKKMAQPKQHTYTTKQPILESAAPSTTSLWNKLSNWIFKPTQEPISLQQIKTQKQQPAPQSIALMNIPQQPSAQLSIDTITNLSQAKDLLKSQENTERNKQKIIFNITTSQWTNLLRETQQHVTWINDNCFKNKNPDATHDDMPTNIYNRVAFFLNKAYINPSSTNIRYHDTTHIDPFGHKAISVEGPTLEYALSPASEGSAITGYSPATITLHSQIVSTLSSNELDAELQHAITHLTQGHNEQLEILENTIGTKQYKDYIQSPEGKQFIASLETTANFLAPIEDYETAKIVQKAFLEKAFDYALKAIKENRKKHGLENSETGLMVCAPPGIELEFLAELQSLEDINIYLETKHKNILRSAGLTDDEIKTLKDQCQKDQEFLQKAYYQTPIDGIFHDSTLDPETLEEIKILLHKAEKNPLSVNIINATKAQMGNSFASAFSPIVTPTTMTGQARLTFCQELINKTPKELVAWAISHEIGHLMKNHTNELRILRKAIEQKNNYNPFMPNPNLDIIIENLNQQLEELAELEADITYLIKDFDFAKKTHKFFIQKTSSPKYDRSKKRSTIHQSFNNVFHWSNKIVQLHAKEKAKSIKIKRFTPDMTRE